MAGSPAYGGATKPSLDFNRDGFDPTGADLAMTGGQTFFEGNLE